MPSYMLLDAAKVDVNISRMLEARAVDVERLVVASVAIDRAFNRAHDVIAGEVAHDQRNSHGPPLGDLTVVGEVWTVGNWADRAVS